MAALTVHARSNSFPAARTSSSSIGHDLNGLQDFYDRADKSLQLPTTKHALINDKECFNELMDGSLRLLDLCNTAKDALSQSKESVSQLQSVIRRRQGGLEGETRRYLKSRSTVRKAIQKATSSNDVEPISMLKEAESAVVEVLECLLSFISQSSSKPSSWSSFVSKLKRIVAPSSENEFADVDASLKTNKSGEEVQVHLKNLQPCIRDLEEGVECLFRRLIKSRASILNINNM